MDARVSAVEKKIVWWGIYNQMATRSHLTLFGIHEHPPAPSATLSTPRARHRAVFEYLICRGVEGMGVSPCQRIGIWVSVNGHGHRCKMVSLHTCTPRKEFLAINWKTHTACIMVCACTPSAEKRRHPFGSSSRPHTCVSSIDPFRAPYLYGDG